MYEQLTMAQRYTISALHKRKVSQKEIAKEIGKSQSTVSRELARNRTKSGSYNPQLAHEMAMERRERIVSNSALEPGVLKEAIRLLTTEQWSPKQISGWLARKGMHISHERIYQEIRNDTTGELAKHTRHNMKHRKRKCASAGVAHIPDRVGIEQRPPEADGTRFGDWEMDLVVDPRQRAILTLVERKTNFGIAELLEHGKKAEPLARTVARLLAPWRQAVLTITTDNGSEFARHALITKLLRRKSLPDVKVFFAQPYAAWQKGAVENFNGLLRQYIPKGTDFQQIDNQYVKQIQKKLNRRPRQKLDFYAPIDVFNKIFQ